MPPPAAAGDVVVGLMSGTSLDGISAAAVRFRAEGERVAHDLLAFVVSPYAAAQRDRLRVALEGAPPAEYCRLGFDLGEWLARAAAAVLAEAGVPRADVRAIASHGQTVWHEPGHSTWQLGEPAVIAERLGLPVVSDFRVRDVAAGGQGAPLVPAADAMLFASADFRALQNIGGMGNVTVVTPGGDVRGVRAFDTGPGVAIIDGVVRALAGAPYDEGGRLAAAGRPVDEVVDALLADPWFASEPPKSTGREKFGRAYAEALIARCRDARTGATNEDCVATATSLTSRSIADAYGRFLPEPVADVLVSGGGAKNATLMRDLTLRLAPRVVRQFDDVFYDGEAKEAVAFALLGWLHLRGRPGNVAGATGARGPRVLGKYTPA
ncbi:MAG TPA: anhydro-N-acetylmuramic acid kinase [Gemmatimonadaceae bacterium]|nr:anhydro-N-acetylmuramic acid kinase [Gemmatimonadaceae bacterium]